MTTDDVCRAALFVLVYDECRSANEYFDIKEREIDMFGYGRHPLAPRAEVVGLEAFVPKDAK